jgi:hypothetical protein
VVVVVIHPTGSEKEEREREKVGGREKTAEYKMGGQVSRARLVLHHRPSGAVRSSPSSSSTVSSSSFLSDRFFFFF